MMINFIMVPTMPKAHIAVLAMPRGSLCNLHQRCVRCDNQTPTGVLIPLPHRSSCRTMKGVVQPTFSPSDA